MARDKFVDDVVRFNIYENDPDEAHSLWGPFPFSLAPYGKIWLCEAHGFPEVIAGEDVDRFFAEAVATHTTGDSFHIRVGLKFGIWHTVEVPKTDGRWVVVHNRAAVTSGENAEEVIREIWECHVNNVTGEGQK